ncbi:ATP-binding protein [Terrimonas sp.]|uniref:AAA family ATPase n=1 Tax=Terrimonas sp. TaxID=1914338 RepID=UPI000D519BAB|nr:AAA family ATPase [Terrimonas sp.]PVD54112.1 ATP-binding protein [Terrimonas sp.]
MEHLVINKLGPIRSADIEFADLTLFVGPQASGKSILLQLIKLLLDKKHIRKTLEQYGFIWGNKEAQILDRYFGEGMSGVWDSKTEITFNNKSYPLSFLLPKRKESIKGAEEQLFYVPAQRVVCLQNGWPRYFTEYEDSVPYVLRQFSETLRQLLEHGIGRSDTIFPQSQRLKEPLRASFNQSIFHDGRITIDKTGKKRFKLDLGGSSIPFMAWSAGQKEFMPLLLSFYWLCPPSKTSKKENIDYVIIEEPEMGLHPQAIKSVILQVMDLMSRGYKVIISTHSPVLLEFAWAFKFLKEKGGDYKSLADLFDVKKLTPPLKEMLNDVLKKNICTYYFDRGDNESVSIKNISSLDAGSDDKGIAEWGGLSSFSTKASDIILKVTADE